MGIQGDPGRADPQTGNGTAGRKAGTMLYGEEPDPAGKGSFLAQKDRRMRFNNAQDPIYYIFDVIENRPVKTLAKEFVKDSILDVISFVSKVVC